MYLEDNSIDKSTGNYKKQDAITFYNLTKCGVDVVDELCAIYSTSRKCNRWRLAMFFRIFDIAGINSYIIFKTNNPNETNLPRVDFLTDLGISLINDHIKRRAQNSKVPTDIRRRAAKRLIPDESSSASTTTGLNVRKKQRCVVCPRSKHIKVASMCIKCNKTMCMKHMQNICEPCLMPVNSESEE